MLSILYKLFLTAVLAIIAVAAFQYFVYDIPPGPFAMGVILSTSFMYYLMGWLNAVIQSK